LEETPNFATPNGEFACFPGAVLFWSPAPVLGEAPNPSPKGDAACFPNPADPEGENDCFTGTAAFFGGPATVLEGAPKPPPNGEFACFPEDAFFGGAMPVPVFGDHFFGGAVPVFGEEPNPVDPKGEPDCFAETAVFFDGRPPFVFEGMPYVASASARFPFGDDGGGIAPLFLGGAPNPADPKGEPDCFTGGPAVFFGGPAAPVFGVVASTPLPNAEYFDRSPPFVFGGMPKVACGGGGIVPLFLGGAPNPAVDPKGDDESDDTGPVFFFTGGPLPFVFAGIPKVASASARFPFGGGIVSLFLGGALNPLDPKGAVTPLLLGGAPNPVLVLAVDDLLFVEEED
jgi:hypothetical protein